MDTSGHPAPRPTPRRRSVLPSDDATTTDLLTLIAELRRRVREANRDRGRVSLTLHMTRLLLDKARATARKSDDEAAEQTAHARQLHFMLRELMEATRPGMAHGELDDDYKLTIAEIRRLRALGIVAELEEERTNPLTAQIEVLETRP